MNITSLTIFSLDVGYGCELSNLFWVGLFPDRLLDILLFRIHASFQTLAKLNSGKCKL